MAVLFNFSNGDGAPHLGITPNGVTANDIDDMNGDYDEEELIEDSNGYTMG